MPSDLMAMRAALRNATPHLLSRARVVATGIGYKVRGGRRTSTLSMVCSVIEKVPRSELSDAEVVPRSIEGMPTDVVETGRIRALQSRTGRHRPAPGGVSIGHRDVTAGTLGCVVVKDGSRLILSNNHVLANGNDAQPGDPILQPGPIDGGRLPDDHLADLVDFVPIRFRLPEPPGDCPTAGAVTRVLNAICRLIASRTRYRVVSLQEEENLVDAAVAKPREPAELAGEILEIGPIRGTADAALGTLVKKSGRTTGLTTGEVLQLDVTADVQYGAGRVARFTDQLLAGPMSQGGDSGSAVLDDKDRLVGLLFAGSDTTTIINRIQNVLPALGVGL